MYNEEYQENINRVGFWSVDGFTEERMMEELKELFEENIPEKMYLVMTNNEKADEISSWFEKKGYSSQVIYRGKKQLVNISKQEY